MLYIVDHHNSFTTAIHTNQLTPNDALLLIQGLRFYQNVYINYQKEDDLFDNEDAPSWSNQDCVIYFYQQLPTTPSAFEPSWAYMVYEDGKWKACDEPDLAPHAQWVQHEIS